MEALHEIDANLARRFNVQHGFMVRARVAGRAEGGGPIWERDVVAMTRARRFAEMRAYRVQSQRALVAQTYIEWRGVSFARGKAAIIGEFGSAHAKLWRTITATIPDGRAAEFSVTKRRALRTQGGPLDPMFRENQFQIPELAILSAMQSAFGSSADIAEQKVQIQAAVSKMVPSFGSLFMTHPSADRVFPTALFAPPDEVEFSGASALEAADQAAFEKAQMSLSKLVKRLRRFTDGDYSHPLFNDIEPLGAILKLLSPQISNGPWLIAAFTQIVMSQN